MLGDTVSMADMLSTTVTAGTGIPVVGLKPGLFPEENWSDTLRMDGAGAVKPVWFTNETIWRVHVPSSSAAVIPSRATRAFPPNSGW